MEENKKRPVLVKTKRWTDGRRGDNDKFPNHEIPGFVPVEYKGIFHQFGTDLEISSDNEFGNQTVAIIEDEDGQIHMVNPTSIKFLDK